MTIWLTATIRPMLRSGLLSLSLAIIPFSALAKTTEVLLSKELAEFGPQIAVRHAPSATQSGRPKFGGDVSALSGQVIQAKNILTELRAFIDETVETVDLGDRLNSRRKDNDRLRHRLISDHAAMETFKDHLGSNDIILSTLTKAVVRNWLETVRLNSRSYDVDRDLEASEKSRLSLERRKAALRQKVVEGQTELLMLRKKAATLAAQLDESRRRVAETHEETRRLETQRRQISTIRETLIRHTTSRLRIILSGKETFSKTTLPD